MKFAETLAELRAERDRIDAAIRALENLVPTRAQAEATRPLSGADASPRGRAQESRPATPSQAPAPASPPARPARVKRREGPPQRRGPAPEMSADERRRIGSIVRAARRARRMTQDAVSAEIGDGMHGRALSAIEVGRGGTGAGGERVRAALAWAQAPHRLDDLEPDPPPTPPTRGNGAGVAWRRRRSAASESAPAPDWGTPAPATAAPLAMDLYRCDALNVRLTPHGCAAAQASGRPECRGCAGVLALAERAA